MSWKSLSKTVLAVERKLAIASVWYRHSRQVHRCRLRTIQSRKRTPRFWLFSRGCNLCARLWTFCLCGCQHSTFEEASFFLRLARIWTGGAHSLRSNGGSWRTMLKRCAVNSAKIVGFSFSAMLVDRLSRCANRSRAAFSNSRMGSIAVSISRTWPI